jgi:hypothetical protein
MLPPESTLQPWEVVLQEPQPDSYEQSLEDDAENFVPVVGEDLVRIESLLDLARTYQSRKIETPPRKGGFEEKNMTAKAEAIKAISELPDDVPLENVMYQLYVLGKIHQGERDVQEGRTISNDDLKREAAHW